VRRFLVVLVLLAGACRDDADEEDAATTAEVSTTTTGRLEATTTTAEARTTTSCPATPASSEPVAARVDLDGDGVEEVWRNVGRGAATDIVELRRIEGCAEVPVLLEDVPAQFAIGGTVLLLQGIRCADGRVVHLGATSDDGERYATLDLFYELVDGRLVRVDDESGELTASDPEVADYSRFDC
jgi:hypothetical protein